MRFLKYLEHSGPNADTCVAVKMKTKTDPPCIQQLSFCLQRPAPRQVQFHLALLLCATAKYQLVNHTG